MKTSRKWMGFAVGLLVGLVPWEASKAQSITGTAQFDAADKLVSWTFDFHEGSSTAALTHLILGFVDTNNGEPDTFWNSAGSISVSSTGSHTASVSDVWPDDSIGTSYLELNFNSSIALDGNNTSFSFNFLTGTAENLSATTTYFVRLYSGGPGTAPTKFDGTEVARANLTVSAADLSAVPEPASFAAWLGVLGLGARLLRRRPARAVTA